MDPYNAQELKDITEADQSYVHKWIKKRALNIGQQWIYLGAPMAIAIKLRNNFGNMNIPDHVTKI